MKKNNSQKKKKIDLEEYAFALTKWVGSPASLFLHTLFFILCFLSPFFGVNMDRMFLFLTTIVSLEAIYLAILIQLSVNKNTEDLMAVGEDIDEIQEDIDEIQENVDEIQEDVDEIEKDIVEIEEGEKQEAKQEKATIDVLKKIEESLSSIVSEIEKLKKK